MLITHGTVALSILSNEHSTLLLRQTWLTSADIRHIFSKVIWVKVFNRQIDSIEITVVLICSHYTVHWLCKCILFLANFVHHVRLKPVHNAIFGDDTRMYYTNECTYEPIMQNGMHRICNCGNDRVFGNFDHHAATIRIDRLYQFLTKYQQFSSLEIKELSWFYVLIDV